MPHYKPINHKAQYVSDFYIDAVESSDPTETSRMSAWFCISRSPPPALLYLQQSGGTAERDNNCRDHLFSLFFFPPRALPVVAVQTFETMTASALTLLLRRDRDE